MYLTHSTEAGRITVSMPDKKNAANDDFAVALYIGSAYATLYLSVTEARTLAADLSAVLKASEVKA